MSAGEYLVPLSEGGRGTDGAGVGAGAVGVTTFTSGGVSPSARMKARSCVSKASAGGREPRSRWKNFRLRMFRNHVCTLLSSKPHRSANFCFSWDEGYGFDACSSVHFSSILKLSDARHSANVRTGKVLPRLGPPPEPLPYWEAILGLFGSEAAAAAMCETGLTLFEASSSDRCTFSCRVGGSGWLVIVVGCGEARAAPASVQRTVVSGWGACGCEGADVARLGPRFWRAPGGGGGAGGC